MNKFRCPNCDDEDAGFRAFTSTGDFNWDGTEDTSLSVVPSHIYQCLACGLAGPVEDFENPDFEEDSDDDDSDDLDDDDDDEELE